MSTPRALRRPVRRFSRSLGGGGAPAAWRQRMGRAGGKPLAPRRQLTWLACLRGGRPRLREGPLLGPALGDLVERSAAAETPRSGQARRVGIGASPGPSRSRRATAPGSAMGRLRTFPASSELERRQRFPAPPALGGRRMTQKTPGTVRPPKDGRAAPALSAVARAHPARVQEAMLSRLAGGRAGPGGEPSRRRTRRPPGPSIRVGSRVSPPSEVSQGLWQGQLRRLAERSVRRQHGATPFTRPAAGGDEEAFTPWARPIRTRPASHVSIETLERVWGTTGTAVASAAESAVAGAGSEARAVEGSPVGRDDARQPVAGAVATVRQDRSPAERTESTQKTRARSSRHAGAGGVTRRAGEPTPPAATRRLPDLVEWAPVELLEALAAHPPAHHAAADPRAARTAAVDRAGTRPARAPRLPTPRPSVLPSSAKLIEPPKSSKRSVATAENVGPWFPRGPSRSETGDRETPGRDTASTIEESHGSFQAPGPWIQLPDSLPFAAASVSELGLERAGYGQAPVTDQGEGASPGSLPSSLGGTSSLPDPSPGGPSSEHPSSPAVSADPWFGLGWNELVGRVSAESPVAHRPTRRRPGGAGGQDGAHSLGASTTSRYRPLREIDTARKMCR